MDWAQVETQLTSFTEAPEAGGPDRHTWLTTIDPDGKPHVTHVGAMWVDGAFWFQTGTGTRKARNLARDGRCSVAVATKDFDIVIEGAARQIREPESVALLASAWAAQGCRPSPTRAGRESPPRTTHRAPARRPGSSTASTPRRPPSSERRTRPPVRRASPSDSRRAGPERSRRRGDGASPNGRGDDGTDGMFVRLRQSAGQGL